jgi:hypothetical protein
MNLKTPIQNELGFFFYDNYFAIGKFLARINASIFAAFPLYFL